MRKRIRMIGCEWTGVAKRAPRPSAVATSSSRPLPAINPRRGGGSKMEKAMTRCPTCGHDGKIVNECRCDPNNLPTKPGLTYRPGIDDCYWYGRKLGPKYAEYRELRDKMAERGWKALYGGTKGHGWWIGDKIKSDEGDTGNPSFWSPREVRKLLATRPLSELFAE